MTQSLEQLIELEKRMQVQAGPQCTFKMQRPIMTTDPQPKVLVYNKHRNMQFHLPLTPELLAFFGDQYKLFVTAQIANGEFQIIKKCKRKPW